MKFKIPFRSHISSTQMPHMAAGYHIGEYTCGRFQLLQTVPLDRLDCKLGAGRECESFPLQPAQCLASRGGGGERKSRDHGSKCNNIT